MTTQFTTPYGYPYPQSTDPVRDGAANIGQLAGTLRAPEMFSGQPCLAGSIPEFQHWRIRTVVYNYAPGTDQFGLLAIPLPFTQCCVTAMILPRNFRDNIVAVSLAQEYCTVTNLAAYPRGFSGNGIASTFVSLTVIAWGY